MNPQILEVLIGLKIRAQLLSKLFRAAELNREILQTFQGDD
jgi:hypothetical protein